MGSCLHDCRYPWLGRLFFLFSAKSSKRLATCKAFGLSFRLDGCATHHHDPLLYGGIFAFIAAAGNYIIFHDPHSIRIGLVSLEIRKASHFFPSWIRKALLSDWLGYDERFLAIGLVIMSFKLHFRAEPVCQPPDNQWTHGLDWRFNVQIPGASRVPQIIVGNVIPEVLASIAVFGRLYTRSVLTRSWGVDDIFVAISWASHVSKFPSPC
jgi:hypothetical protein